jgi:GntR family phosphonate transport system transcriptional regulator
MVHAQEDQALALDVPLDQALLRLQTLGEGEGYSLHVSERFFPLPRFQHLTEAVRMSGSITTALKEHGVKDYVRQESRISARLPSVEVADLLEQPVSRPVLLVTSVNVDADGRPIEYARTWFAGDRVTLTVNHHD